MLPVVTHSRSSADLNKMKFLVLAMCVCAASAAYKPWQPVQKGAQAVASAVVTVPVVVAKAAYAPVKAVVVEPVAKAAAYVSKDASAEILRSESDISDNAFHYGYETANGISAESSGVLKQVGSDNFYAVQGKFRYITPEGLTVETSYVADENGYQPQGDSLPVGPAIPEYIIRSLEYIRTHPPKDDVKY